MAGPALADVSDARFSVHFGGDRLEDRLDQFPTLDRATGHDGGPLAGAFLSAGNTRADVKEALFGQSLRAAFGVDEVGIAAINDEIAGLKERHQRIDNRVDGVPVSSVQCGRGLDEQHDFARALQGGDETFKGIAADQALPRVRGDKVVGDRRGPVVDGNLIAAAFDVEDEILSHDRQSD